VLLKDGHFLIMAVSSTPRPDVDQELLAAELGPTPDPPPLEHSDVCTWPWAPSSQPAAGKQKRRRRKKQTSSAESDDADSESSDAPSPSTTKAKQQRKPPKSLSFEERRKLATLPVGLESGNRRTMAQLGAVFDVDASTARKFRKRFKEGKSLKDKRPGPPPAWPVPRALRAIASLAYAQGRSVDDAARAAGIPRKAFVKVRAEVERRLQCGVVEFWLGGTGEEEVVGYIDGAADTVDVGVSILTNLRVVDALLKALERGVEVRIMVDLDFARSTSFECLKLLIEAGIQVCHCSDTYGWKVAVFDDKLLLLGSQNWSDEDLRGPDEGCAVVLFGPIVAAFSEKLARQFALAEIRGSEYGISI